MHVHGEYGLMKINLSMTIFNIKHFVVSISFTTFVLQLKDITLTINTINLFNYNGYGKRTFNKIFRGKRQR